MRKPHQHFNNKIHPNSIRNIQAMNRISNFWFENFIQTVWISFVSIENSNWWPNKCFIEKPAEESKRNKPKNKQKNDKKNTKIECKKKSFRIVRLVCEFFDGFGRVVRYMRERKKGNKKVCRSLYKQWAVSSKQQIQRIAVSRELNVNLCMYFEAAPVWWCGRFIVFQSS